jgi:hypothetical protein
VHIGDTLNFVSLLWAPFSNTSAYASSRAIEAWSLTLVSLCSSISSASWSWKVVTRP